MDKKFPSRADLIRRHSQARVLVADNKVFVTEWHKHPNGELVLNEAGQPIPKTLSRRLTAADVRENLVRKFA